MAQMHFWPIFSGSSGNAVYIAYNDTRLLIDAGISSSRLETALKKVGVDIKSLDGVLVTHEHSDHICGLNVLSRRHGVPVYANAAAWAAMESKVGIPSSSMKLFQSGAAFHIKDLCISAFRTPHDAAEPVGYAVSGGGFTACVMTDLGHVPKGVLECAKGADIVLLESNHDIDMLEMGHYPEYLKRRILSDKGHLSNVSAGKAAVQLAHAGVRNIVLGHISRENNEEKVAFDTVAGALAEDGFTPDDVDLGIAYRDRYGCFYRIK